MLLFYEIYLRLFHQKTRVLHTTYLYDYWLSRKSKENVVFVHTWLFHVINSGCVLNCPLFRLLSCLCFGILHFAIFRFKYNCFYELDSLAVVNVRDLGGIKHTFKLLVPEARLFQCANAEAKKVSGATSVSLYVVSVVHFSSTDSDDANDDFYWLI